jgi:hypothetical protein
MIRGRVCLVVAAALAATLVGCSKPAAEPGTQGQPPAPTSAPPAPTTPPATPIGEEQIGSAEAILADGRHPVFITSIDVGKRTMRFDLLIFLTGEKAKEEWAKTHPGEEGPMNDYMIVNNNPKLRTLPVIADARIQIIDPEHYDPTTLLEVDLAKLRAEVEKLGGGASAGPFWITVRADKITRVEEQFIP